MSDLRASGEVLLILREKEGGVCLIGPTRMRPGSVHCAAEC